TGNGYLGGLQWTMATWRANGGVGSPVNASAAQQIAVAERLIATQGMARGLANWPVCQEFAHASSPSAPPAPPPARQTPARQPPIGSTPRGPLSTYTVIPNDSLSIIAEKLRISAVNGVPGWRRIATANRNLISNPDLIQPNWILTIPQ